MLLPRLDDVSSSIHVLQQRYRNGKKKKEKIDIHLFDLFVLNNCKNTRPENDNFSLFFAMYKYLSVLRCPRPRP